MALCRVSRGVSLCTEPFAALVAVMRKLLLLANALLRQNRPWTPKAGDEQPAEEWRLDASCLERVGARADFRLCDGPGS